MNRIVKTRQNRRGNASLELALFLPFWAFFLMLIFSTAVVNLSHLNVEMDTRYQSWKYRHTPWLAEGQEAIANSVSASDLKIGGGRFMSHPASVVKEDLTLDLIQIPGGLTSNSAKGRHYLVGGAWDHRELEFSNHHSRLTLMPKVNYFSGRINRQIFRAFGFR